MLRSNVGPASKPLEKVVKPKQEPPLQKQDDVAALLSRVGALEGQSHSVHPVQRLVDTGAREGRVRARRDLS